MSKSNGKTEFGFTALLTRKQRTLLKNIEIDDSDFRWLASESNSLVRDKGLRKYFGRMMAHWDAVRATKSPAAMMAAEYLLLRNEEAFLKDLFTRVKPDAVLKADWTINQKTMASAGAALAALHYQSIHASYHKTMKIGAALTSLDTQKPVVDAVRGAVRTIKNSLQNEMRGLTRTELELVRRDFLAKRVENMSACEAVYKKIQKESENI